MKDTKPNSDYNELHELSKKIATLEGISHLLEWDQETHMPPGAAQFRGDQIKAMAGIIHNAHTSPEYKKTLSKLIDIESGEINAKNLTSSQTTALKRWRRDYRIAKALPEKFVEEFAKLTSQSLEAWRSARKENAFQQFAPYLDKIVQMQRKKADYLGFEEHPYDALMDLYEPEAKTSEIDKLFGQLSKSITKILKKIQSSKKIDDSFLYGKFDTKKQLEFGKQLMLDMGYDMQKGRLDISSHPFSSSSHPTDSRITTRIHPTSLMSNVSVIMHEVGHSLYEMGLPIEHFGSPLGQAISLGVHESQSRWWETRIGQSKSFWTHYLPLLKKAFKGKIDTISLDKFYKAINKVEPSLIRVEADEVTYSLHVILRFELEKRLIEGSLAIRDVPEAWNEKMQELLGVVPSTNADGCLQDIHWSMGGMGYFPTYTLGNLYASHLFQGFEKEHSDWQKRVSNGELLFIKEWLNKNVHQHGRTYNSKELLKKATGKEFSHHAYTNYLEEKYNEIYK